MPYSKDYYVVAYDADGKFVTSEYAEMGYDEEDNPYYRTSLYINPGVYTVKLKDTDVIGYRLLTPAEELAKQVEVKADEGAELNYEQPMTQYSLCIL